MSTHKKGGAVIALTLLILWIVITVVKFGFFDYSLKEIMPKRAFRVTVDISGKNSGREINVTHFMVPTATGQELVDEQVSGTFTSYDLLVDGENRLLSYNFAGSVDSIAATLQSNVLLQRVAYTLSDSLTVTEPYADYLQKWLGAEEMIQVGHEEIQALAEKLKLTGDKPIKKKLTAAYDYCYNEIESARFSGETDALLTEQLGQASCNGKSRLLVALLRTVGIPSRLVGGVILEDRMKKKTSHQWVEAYVEGNWVPFCPLNGYYAEKPQHYLRFYVGDKGFFTRTKNIHFEYRFSAMKKMVPVLKGSDEENFFDLLSVWESFEEAGISLGMLSTVLVIPLGALITIIFRNVIGVKIFGTFLPALIAYSFIGTGFWWGMFIFVVIILVGAFLNIWLDKLKLLHTPRLTVIMVFTALILVALGYWGISSGSAPIAHSFFFPLAILSVTIEKFFNLSRDQGVKGAFTMLFWTLIVVSICYHVMSSLFLQMLVVVLPETYLLIVAAALYLGHWTGLRVYEIYRFRSVIFKGKEA